MNQALLDKIEAVQYRKETGDFGVGDSVRVHTKVVEGDKERIQIFSGVVIGRRGHGLGPQTARALHRFDAESGKNQRKAESSQRCAGKRDPGRRRAPKQDHSKRFH